jgi:hypothetical protein
MSSWFKRLAVILLVLVSITLGIWHLVDALKLWNPEFISNDMVYAWDKRLQKVRAGLPADVRIVGYVGDWDILPADEYYYAGEETEYVLTQYALSPVIVQRGDHYEWVIVNMTPKAYDIWLKRQPQNTKVIDYGLRIFLIHRQ